MSDLRRAGSAGGHARLRDLTIVPVPESYDQWYAEAVIFGSGRPTLVLPESPRARPFELGTVAVAWDFSRAAARAVSDAMPLLEKARKVRIVTVTNEKKLDSKHSAEALAKNLARHGIDVVLDKVDADGRRDRRGARSLHRFASGRRSRDGRLWARDGANSSSAAPPRACCRSRRSRSCSRIEGRFGHRSAGKFRWSKLQRDHSRPPLKVRRVNLDTGRENVVVISRHSSALRPDIFRGFSRVELQRGSKVLLATLLITDDDALVGADEIGSPSRRSAASPSRSAVSCDGRPAAPPESLDAVRGKIQGRTFEPAEIDAIIKDLTHYRYSDMEVAAFLISSASFMTSRELLAWFTRWRWPGRN